MLSHFFKRILLIVITLSITILSTSCKLKKDNSSLSINNLTENNPLNNYSAIIQQKIAQLKDNQTLILEKNTYHFRPQGAYVKELYISNHDQDNPKKVAFFLENLNNITIDGNGSEFIFHGTMIPIVLKNCSNITLKNFSIDFESPHIRQLEILEVDKTNNITIAQIYPNNNYEINNDKLYLTGEDFRRKPIVAMAFQKDKRLAYQRPDVDFTPKKISEIKPNVLKIEGWQQNPLTSVGERFALRTYQRPAPSIVVDYCKNTTIKNVNIHYADGMGLIAQMSENITLDKFSVCLKEGDQRYFTTQADATHFSACKGIIRSENGLYEGMADDAINVHGTYLKITKKINNTTIQASYMHPQAWGFLWGEAGDKVQFVASNTMELVDNQIYQIKSIKAVDKPTEFGAKVFEISFTQNIPTEISEEKPFGVENLTWTPEVIFKNNIIRNNRARGALFSTPKKVICENNLFDHTHGTAILLCGDCNGWYETGACRDVSIRNNKFINSLTANYQFTNAIISIYPEIPNLKAQKQFFHSGIVIEDNIFETFDNPILYAKSIENLIFKNNRIIKNNEFQPFHWNKNKFFFERARNIKINDPTLSKKDIKMNLCDENTIILE